MRALDALPVTRVLRCSRTYRSAPIEAGGPDYLNAVAELDTAMPPRQLLDALHAIEARHGRERPWRNAPRTLDLDLLLHGDSVCPTRDCCCRIRACTPAPSCWRRSPSCAPT